MSFWNRKQHFYGFVGKWYKRTSIPTTSLRGPVTTSTREAAGRVYWMGWDGMDGMDGMDGVSKVSFNFLYTLCVYRLCIITSCIFNQKLSPTSLWVSKFDVKLEVVIKNFKFTAGRWFFIFWPKSSLFFFTSRWEAFFAKNWKKTGRVKDFTKDFTNDFVVRLF